MCQDCEVLHERLQQQAGQMFQMRKAIVNLRGQLKYERREKEKILKDRRQEQKRQHYRNGQKRGRTRNG